MKSPSRKKAPGGNLGRHSETDGKTDSTFQGKVNATGDLSHAALFEKSALILSKSIFRNQFSSPDVTTLETALRLLMLDAAQFHRHRANHRRKDAGFLFEREAA